MHTSVITKKGQIVIPAPLRHKLGLHEGTRVRISEAADGLRVQPLDRAYFEARAGLLPGRGKAIEALIEQRRQEQAREDHRP